MLKINSLDVFYGTAHVLEDIFIHVEEQEMVAILGANGAGKSTLLRTISGLVRPRSGNIEFQGRNITGLSPDEIVALGITQCPEGRRLFPDMSVYKNLLVGAYVFRRDKARINRLLETVFQIFPILQERKEQMAGTLSGGEQQMLAIGRALMSEPKLLMLDEMSLGLAPKVVENLFRTIKKIKERGITIILVEQNAAKALATSDRVYVMESGKIAVAGLSRDLLKDPKIRSAYLGI
ncbi:MAG TPA: ABC transporter ATP-binding protein [Syntrophales bacterium]|nr:ABC transporter ATP-binding protein [Syntrophales bacterium]HOL58641.1 ABC transporter ATP-binding protein [Syntrophales bacterium]HPO35071.1 ABC transporter ATP-binding protein [Syntrophales bacterium]